MDLQVGVRERVPVSPESTAAISSFASTENVPVAGATTMQPRTAEIVAPLQLNVMDSQARRSVIGGIFISVCLVCIWAALTHAQQTNDVSIPNQTHSSRLPAAPLRPTDPVPPTDSLDILCSDLDNEEFPSRDERNELAPYWRLSSAPPIHVQFLDRARVALVVPSDVIYTWKPSAKRFEKFVGDKTAAFPPLPGALPDDMIFNLEALTPGGGVSALKPVLCGTSASSDARVYIVPLRDAAAATSQLNPPSGIFVITGAVLLRNWTWNCELCDGGNRVKSAAKETRVVLPELIIHVGVGPPSAPPATTKTSCDDTATALMWRRETPGSGGCGLGCDGRGYALGPPSCAPIRAPEIQQLFIDLGYPAGVWMFGDSNTRRAFRTLSGLLSQPQPGKPFSTWCGARRDNWICMCNDNVENWKPPPAEPPFPMHLSKRISYIPADDSAIATHTKMIEGDWKPGQLPSELCV
jgi:hypothetical protein